MAFFCFLWDNMNILSLKKRVGVIVFTLGLLVCFVFFSLGGETKADKYVKRWYGKTFVFPDSMIFRKYGKDIVNYKFQNSQYKILALVDSSACIGCQLRIDDWQRFIADIDSSTCETISLLFIMSPISVREVYTVLRSSNFVTPVCIDNSLEIRSLNDVPPKTSHVFLLDKKNKIICVGDPISNRKVRDIYRRIINCKKVKK